MAGRYTAWAKQLLLWKAAKKGDGARPELQATRMARDRDSEVANLRLKSNELTQSCVEGCLCMSKWFSVFWKQWNFLISEIKSDHISEGSLQQLIRATGCTSLEQQSKLVFCKLVLTISKEQSDEVDFREGQYLFINFVIQLSYRQIILLVWLIFSRNFQQFSAFSDNCFLTKHSSLFLFQEAFITMRVWEK